MEEMVANFDKLLTQFWQQSNKILSKYYHFVIVFLRSFQWFFPKPLFAKGTEWKQKMGFV